MSGSMASMGTSDEPLLITAKEFAQKLNVSLRQIWRMLSEGRIPQPVRLGGTVRWRLAEVKSWIEEGCPQQPTREMASG
ncbi:excisionase family DNA-binding protein [bacterium]|nr:excisionase family DNA-binding protein [bacterium]